MEITDIPSFQIHESIVHKSVVISIWSEGATLEDLVRKEMGEGLGSFIGGIRHLQFLYMHTYMLAFGTLSTFVLFEIQSFGTWKL